MALLLSLKTKLYAIGIGIIAALIGVIKWQAHRNSTLKNEVNIARKNLKLRENIDTIDEEIEQDFSHRAEEARRDLDNDQIPEHLRNR
jgi:hypothetical protein